MGQNKYFPVHCICTECKSIKKGWKNWLFGFCEALALCIGAKPNVPFVRLAKIVFGSIPKSVYGVFSIILQS